MIAVKFDSRRLLRLVCWLGCCAALAAMLPSEVLAQGIRRGGGGSKNRGGPQAQQPDAPKDIPGTMEGRVLKYTAADDGDREKDEDLIGFLKVKPFDKEQKVLTVAVRRGSGLKVELASQNFEVEDLKEILLKGLHITAGWGFVDPDAKRKVKELRSLTFNTIEVEGTIEKVEDGMVILKCKPKNNGDWPGIKDDRRPVNANSKTEKRIPFKKLKLKVLEEVAKMVNEEGDEISASDLELEKAVHAKVVFSHGGEGYLLTLGPPDVSVTNEPPGGGETGQPPPPRGPRPRRGGADR